MAMRWHLLSGQCRLADSAGHTVRMGLGAARGAGRMLIGRTHNHAPAQIRHAATVTEYPVLTGLCLPGHDGPTAIAPAEGHAVDGNREARREHCPRIDISDGLDQARDLLLQCRKIIGAHTTQGFKIKRITPPRGMSIGMGGQDVLTQLGACPIVGEQAADDSGKRHG